MQKSHERRTQIFWCSRCNVPILSEKCGICGSNGNKIMLHHGREIRPGFEYTLNKINQILEKKYGVKEALNGKLVLLHKVAGIDRTEEIIVDGKIFGTFSYIPEEREFQIFLRSYGAAYLRGKGAHKNIVTVNEKALERHLKNTWIFAEELLDIAEISPPQDIILSIGKYTGVGIPKFHSREKIPKKCIKVRDIGVCEFQENNPDFHTIVKANADYIDILEKTAISEIKRTLMQHKNMKIAVSFSGGKDSAVAFHLLSKVTSQFDVIFVDTGLEFPETVEYVKKMAKGKPLFILKPEHSFWDLVDSMGPPAKDYRWCCKVCKLAPVASHVGKYGEILTVEGRRRAESFAREKINLIEKNPFVPGQILVNPIRNWCAFEIWLYILKEHIPVNPLYFHDFERIGCYLCPSAHACEFDEVASLHPEMYERWQNYLKFWAEKNGMDEDYWRKGLWRWKTPPRKIRREKSWEEKRNIHIKESITCNGEYLIDGNFNTGLSQIEIGNALGILGEMRYLESTGTIMIKLRKSRILFFANSDFSVVSTNREEGRKLLVKIIQQLLRGMFCTSCMICKRACPVGCIDIRDGKPEYNLQKCKKCGHCIEACVVARYWDKRIALVFSHT
ncbi:MAG: phosphoadenosine phosphosulfate reductase family protein [Thermoplasmata archaeon]